MKKNILLLTAITSIFINLTQANAKGFQDTELKKATKTKLEFYPTKLTKTKGKECLDFGKNCLVPLTKKPILKLESFSFKKVPGNEAGVLIYLDEKDAKKLQKASSRYLNTRLALVHNGDVLMAPVLKSLIDGEGFKITFQNPKNFEKVLESLN